MKAAQWILNPKHPAWYKRYICDNCKGEAPIVSTGGHLSGGYGPEAIGAEWVEEKESFLSPYCPFCGSKMENAIAIFK